MSLQLISKVSQLKKLRDQRRSARTPIVTNEAVIPTEEDFEQFASKLRIRSGTKLIPFTPLYEYQLAITRLAAHCRGLVVVKDRQLGVTEVLIAWMLHRARHNRAYAGCTFSLTEKDAHKISQRVKRMPSQMKDFEWAIDSVGVRSPKEGGELNFRPSTENATRGLESIWDLFFDESGFLPDGLISEMYAASTPSQEMVGDDARTFIVSTIPPTGRDCWFWGQLESNNPLGVNVEEMLKIARSGGHQNDTDVELPQIPGFCCWADEAGWIKVVIGHKAHPIYGADPNYVKNQQLKKKLTEEQAEREHNLGLPKQGATLFNVDAITASAVGVWDTQRIHRHYFSMLDPNMGGDDRWCLLTWDITDYPFRLVHEYAISQQSPNLCFLESIRVLDQFKPVLLAVEKNNGGLKIAEDFANKLPWLQVEVVNTSATSKRVNTDRIAIALVSGDVIYPDDWRGIDELKKFSALHREAISGHDDRVMAWAIGWSHLETALALKPAKVEFRSTGKRASQSLRY